MIRLLLHSFTIIITTIIAIIITITIKTIIILGILNKIKEGVKGNLMSLLMLINKKNKFKNRSKRLSE